MRKHFIITVALLIIPFIPAAAESYRIEPIDGFSSAESNVENFVSRKHTGSVTSISPVKGTSAFFAAGRDGFVSRFSGNSFEEIWQVSELPVLRVAADPSGTRIATYESDGFSIHRISVWDWENKKRLYAKRFRDAVTELSWSAQGSYIIVGHSSLEGITVLNASSGSVKPVFEQSPGIVTLALTGSSETSIITFGPSGIIRYTDFRNGTERASYQSEPDLASPSLLNNNIFIAGRYGNTLYCVDATSGDTISSYETADPVLFSDRLDKEPRWFENERTGAFVRTGSADPVPVHAVPGKITAAASLEKAIVFGTDTGALFTIPRRTAYEEDITATALAANDINAVDCAATDGSTVYLLSKGSVFAVENPSSPPTLLFSGMSTSNRMTLTENGMLFWSSTNPASVIHTGADGENRKELYKAADGISSLSLYGNFASCVAGGHTAVILDLTGEQVPFTYEGVGLQDAVLINTERLIISKSATRIAPHVLVSINPRTGETVPLQLEGNLLYGLSRAPNEQGRLHAFRVMDGTTTITELIALDINPSSPGDIQTRVLARYGDEDTEASLSADSGKILTTLGKSSLVELNIRNRRQVPLERSYALPVKPLFTGRYIVTVNRDGSITWYERNNREMLVTSFISPEGFWISEE